MGSTPKNKKEVVSTAPLNPSEGIVFNNQQQAALEDMGRWVANEGGKDGKPYILRGYAGTGKTTLVRALLNSLKIPLSRVALVAPTNRAAKVLQNKTGLHTQTIHRLIYLTVREELEYQRERLHMWEIAKNFTDLADLIITSNETDLREMFHETYGGGNEDEFQQFREKHRTTVLKYEDVILPDNPSDRLDYFVVLQKERVEMHKDKVRELLKEDLKVRKKKPEEVIDLYNLIVVDEASMVSETVGADLVSFGVPVILVGDPFQLPPVKANPYWHNRAADSELTRIERQKGKGAGIPLAGERLRKGERVSSNDSLQLHSRGTLSNEIYTNADQIICGTHRVRERMCRVVRKELGFSTPHPQPGEKVVATYNDRALGIMNGELYKVLKSETRQEGRLTIMDLEDPYGKVLQDVTAWTKGFEGREHTQYLPESQGRFWWGYCITCHQSQGSEWKHVVVCDDWPGREDKDRWLYTAITRASEKCDLVSG